MSRATSTLTCVGAALALALAAGACGAGSTSVEGGSSSHEAAPAGGLGFRDADDDTQGTAPAGDMAEADHVGTIGLQMVSAVIDEEWPLLVMIPDGWHVENNVWGALEVRSRDYGDQGSLRPEPGDAFSIFTTMAFDTRCDGRCEANDWQARLNGPDGFLTVYREGRELLRDDAIPGGWVTVEPDRPDVEVTVLRWEDTASRFLKCTVDIDEDDVHLVDQFVDACAAAVPLWFNG